MQRKRILFLGYGDIAQRTAAQLQQHEITGVARSPKKTAEYVNFIQATVDSLLVCNRLATEHWDVIVITLTPKEFSDEGYKTGYVLTLKRLLEFICKNPPNKLFFVSSTSVYQHAAGEWVDEQTVCEPDGFSGQRLLESEQLLRDVGIDFCILRAAGIYGPGRTFLLSQVRKGQGGSEAYTNRIHAQDCAGFIAHLINLSLADKPIEDLYLVADGNPVTGKDIRIWLADQMGMDGTQLTPSDSARGGNKRCRNDRLLASGYTLKYPDYKIAYREIIDEWMS